jgi:RHS repeat-associated protein
VNGHITLYTYDNFGRLITTKLSTGKIISSTYDWVTDNTPSNARYYISSESYGSPTTNTYFDILGRELRNWTYGFEGAIIYNDIEYYPDGNIKRERGPYKYEDSEIWTSYSYDSFKRIDGIITPTCSMDYSYSGKTVSVTDCKGRSVSNTVNSAGDITTATDIGGSIYYYYHSSGQARKINAAGSVDSMFYNEYGRQWKLTDPDAGTVTYTYNSLGELLTQTNAKGQQTSLTYDQLGRISTKNTIEGTITYTYDNATYGKGLVSSVSSNNNTVSYTYDEYSRLSSESNTIDGIGYTSSYTYDNNKGKISQITYPSQFAIINEYDNFGYLKRVKRSDNQSLIWECTGINRYGQVTGANLGNGLALSHGYNQYGFPTTIQTGSVQNMQFYFNDTTGNLEWRKDSLTGRGLTENFTYDPQDRLTNCIIGSNYYPITYHNNGNISTKHDAGVFAYETRPHALSGLSDSPINDPKQEITYNSFQQPDTIEQESKRLVISYGVDEQRIKSVFTENSDNWTRKYIGNYEEVYISGQITKKIHYIHGGDGLAAIYIIDSTGTGEIYYASKDYLGNILVLTKQNGTVAEEYSFDAWGRRRSPTNWNNYSVSVPTILYRGYTGHEHLDEFALINMNGRCYDPITGRFLSLDNFVQDPFSTQSYNRFSYALNNPLKYTDPSGWYYYPKEGSDMGGGDGGEELNYDLDLNGYPIIDESLSSDYSYTYDWYSGYYRNAAGNIVNWNKVDYNYVAPNSITFRGQNAHDLYDGLIAGYDIYAVYAHRRTNYVLAEGGKNYTYDYFFQTHSDFIGGLISPEFDFGIVRNFYYLASNEGGYSGDNIFLETWFHFQVGGGKDLNVSTSALDFSFVKKSDLVYDQKAGIYRVNLFNINPFNQTSLALGEVELNKIGTNQYEILQNRYDFDIRWRDGITWRNIGTAGGAIVNYGIVPGGLAYPVVPYKFGGPYNINFQGTVTINP